MNKYSQESTPYTSLPFPPNLFPLPSYLEYPQSNLITNLLTNILQYQTPNSFVAPEQLIYDQLARQNKLQCPYYFRAILQLNQQRENQLIQQTLLANAKKEDDLPIRNASPSSSQLSSITAPSKTSMDKPLALIQEDPKASSILKQTRKIAKAPRNLVPSCDSGSSSQDEKCRKTRKIWTHAEDAKLLALIDKYGMKWTDIGREIGGRTGKQVRDRYLNNLRSDLTNTPWTPEEDELLKSLYYILGSKWCVVAIYLPGRSEAQVKNRFYKQIKGELRPEEDKKRIINVILNWRKNFVEENKDQDPKDLPPIKKENSNSSQQGLMSIEQVLTLLYHKKDISNIYISRKLLNNMPLLDLLVLPEDQNQEENNNVNKTKMKKENDYQE